jgi:hypothetical protein
VILILTLNQTLAPSEFNIVQSEQIEREFETHEEQSFDFYPIDSETNDGFEQEFEQPNQHVEYVESEAVLSSNGSSYRLKIFIYFEHNIYSYFI